METTFSWIVSTNKEMLNEYLLVFKLSYFIENILSLL